MGPGALQRKLIGKSRCGRGGGSIRAACGPDVGGGGQDEVGGEGGLVAEGLEPADQTAGLTERTSTAFCSAAQT